MLLNEALISYGYTNSYKAVKKLKSEDLKLTVSFVIPVHNSEKSLRECIRQIYKQRNRKLINEIILINDGSTDNSGEILNILREQYKSKLKIVIKSNKKRMYAAFSRNRGIEASTGDLICFIDSDILIPTDYVITHARYHQLNKRCITFSLRQDIEKIDNNTPVFSENIPSDFRAAIIEKNNNLQGKKFNIDNNYTLAELCLTCAVTYKRNDLLKVQGCPENFKGWGFNDTAMAAKVIALNRKVIPIKECLTFHMSHPPRSGSEDKKLSEYEKNKVKYKKLLELPIESTYKFNVKELESVTIKENKLL